MSRERIPVRTIKEVLRLKWSCGLSRRAISKSCGIARSTVDEYMKRARQAGSQGGEAKGTLCPRLIYRKFRIIIQKVNFGRNVP